MGLKQPLFFYLSVYIVLVLIGAGLIFFIVASKRLCFGFVLETVLIMQGWFSYC